MRMRHMIPLLLAAATASAGDNCVVVFPPETAQKGDVARYTLEIRLE